MLLLLLVPPWEIEQIRGVPRAAEGFADLVNKYRATWAQILGGLALLGGLWVTWQTLQVNRDEKITARFSKAIELLGDERLSVRLGGIYSLERIARDSQRDHFTVVETLTAFVRERVPNRQPCPERGWLPVDVQAALTVVGRREVRYEEGVTRYYLFLNFADTDLRRAMLPYAQLDDAWLVGANLEQALLPAACLKGATLTSSNLARADLRWAYLEGAKLENANLEAANLDGAYLWKAELQGAILRGADLRGAIGLTREQLGSAIVDETTLLPPDLREATPERAASTGGEQGGVTNLHTRTR